MLKSGHNAKQNQNFRTGMKKHKNTDSGLVQQLSLSVPTAREDLAPQVQAGCGRGEHDQVLLLQAKAAHARGWVVVARPGEDLPVDVVGVVLVLQLPHMCRESGARLVAVPTVALMLPDPVPDCDVREPSVGLLLPGGEVGDLGPIDHPLGHAVARHWALLAPRCPLHPPLNGSFSFLTLLLCWHSCCAMLGMVE